MNIAMKMNRLVNYKVNLLNSSISPFLRFSILPRVLLGFMLMFIILPHNLNAQECKAKITINTNSDSSLIYINSVLSGKGNIEDSLSPGNYFIEIIKDKREWGSEVISDSIIIANCENHYKFEFNFETRQTLNTVQKNVAVFNNNQLVGYTPFPINKDYKELTLRKQYHLDKTIYLNGSRLGQTISLDYIGKAEEESFTSSSLFKILVGSAVALGAASAYFKLKADKEYDKYLDTRRQSHLDETNRLDLYSGIAFGALQINFGALLYFFLFD